MTERSALRFALGLNLALAAIEIVAGLWSRSIALLVDAADFLEDSAIYALALRLGGRDKVDKARIGLVLAGLMAMPGAVALWQLWRRFVTGDVPHGATIWAVSTLALAANAASAVALRTARQGGRRDSIGLTAAWLSSRNDVIANLAMIAAGIAVAQLGAGWPDTLVGLGVAALHFSGAVAVARLALRKDRAL